ncbi:cytochrome c oxidase accessory protein CcoG [Paraglaciecola sp. L3A3]|uniref:cytochrome c oxidase accessory protein CcoG n=1 Tax=Paraglaciecola sp. L3A3 TaxID=2686358 RepID=UPI001E2FC2EB|nr:cytochrome c oxidase accessory protein CcoG [Paraglaciecola sp. L3A3]
MANTQKIIPIKIIDVPQATASQTRVHIAKPEQNKIYVRSVKGTIETFRRFFGALSLFIFSAIPWLTYQGQQAILLDFSEQRFRLFNITLWPQDLVLVSWIFVIAAFLLFFITTVVGRVWCGFMCPQTVYTFVFIWLEEKIEGTRNKRIHLDKQHWSLSKVTKKVLKHSAWLAVALFTAMTFVGYFVSIKPLFINFFTFQSTFWPVFWVLLFTFCTYANAGWMREIMCTHMCPYSRFQSAMFDRDTKTVTYDRQRGESRGPRSRKLSTDQVAEKGLGDCIDCNLCVQVCPTGIDIRNGLQYECINCGACVDACNNVMDNMNYPKNLISFTSESQLAGQKAKLFRPKVIGYLFVTMVILAVMALQFNARTVLELNVLRDRTSLYRESNQGMIENIYTLILMNKSQSNMTVSIEKNGLAYDKLIGAKHVELAAGELLRHPISLTVEPNMLDQAITPFEFVLKTDSASGQAIEARQQTTFIYQ